MVDMSLRDYVLVLPDYLNVHPEKRLEVKATLLDRLSREITSRTQIQELNDVLRQCFDADDMRSFDDTAAACLNAHLQRSGQGKAQDYTRFPKYISEGLLARLKSCGDDYAVAVCLITFLKNLGLRTPSEATVRSITAYVLLLSKADHLKDTAEDLLGMVHAMKRVCRSIFQGSSWPWTNPPLMSCLPDETAQIDPLWRHEALGTELPMQVPPVPMEVVAARAGGIPLRRSHREIQKQGSSSQNLMGSTPALTMVGSIFKDVLAIVADRNDRQTSAKITMLTSPKRKEPTPLLALENAPARSNETRKLADMAERRQMKKQAV